MKNWYNVDLIENGEIIAHIVNMGKEEVKNLAMGFEKELGIKIYSYKYSIGEDVLECSTEDTRRINDWLKEY